MEGRGGYGRGGGEVGFRQSTETQFLVFLYEEYPRRRAIPLLSLAGGFLFEKTGWFQFSFIQICV